jgi:hypothetical protein
MRAVESPGAEMDDPRPDGVDGAAVTRDGAGKLGERCAGQ